MIPILKLFEKHDRSCKVKKQQNPPEVTKSQNRQ